MILRFINKLFTARVMGLLLVVMALQVFTYGVASSLRNTDTTYFFYICLLAALIGLGAGKINSKPIPAAAGLVALGLVGIWILGARLATPLLEWFKSALAVLPQIVPALQSKTTIDTTQVAEAWTPIVTASVTLWLRFQTWLIGFNRNVSVNDALIRNLVWLFLQWLVAAWVGWFTARRNAVTALLPAITILAFVTSYSEFRIETVWVLIFLTIVLMGVWNYQNHIQLWEFQRVDYSDSIRYDNTQAVLGLAIAICTVAILTPSLSWQDVRDYLREHNQNSQSEAADILGLQQQSVTAKGVATQAPALPRDYLLTGGFAQSQKIVMTIHTGELPPIVNPALTANAPRYYWRSAIYDEYMGSGWVTSSAPPQKFPANTPLIPGLLNNYKLLHLDVTLTQPEGKLFWSGALFSADVPLTVDWRFRPPSDLFADQAALLQADMFAALTTATAYRAESYVPNVTVTDLRAASTEYPPDILARYLVLPRSVPRRVRNLAEQITQAQATPYDKAKALETYLRTNYPYDLEVPAPPANREVADYFLFDLKRGYCDYYATTMVVMARAVGIPARFVSGYSPGSYDAPNAEYVIRELNAHSWAELYFTGIGWVEFEPTGSIPEITRTETLTAPDLPQENDTSAAQLLNRFRLTQVVTWLAPVFGISLMALFYFIVLERWWYLRQPPAQAIEKIYRKFYRAGRPFAGVPLQAETAHEFAEKTIRKLEELKSVTTHKRILTELANHTVALTALYNSALFVDTHTTPIEAHNAWHIWSQLRWRLWIARINLYQFNRMQKQRAKLQSTS